jgi:hypothetical protein
MSTKLLRPKDIYGPGNPIPVGHTKFWQHYVRQPDGPEFIPDTKIPRLRLVSLGNRMVGAFADEVAELIDTLRTLRDTSPPRQPRRVAREHAVKGGRTSAAKRARNNKSRRSMKTLAGKAGASNAVERS